MFAQIPKLSKRFWELAMGIVWEGKGYIYIYIYILYIYIHTYIYIYSIHANPLPPRWTDNSHGRFGGWTLVTFCLGGGNADIFFSPWKLGKIFTHFDGRIFLSNGLVQAPTMFCLHGFHFIGVIFLYKDLSRAPRLKLGGTCLDDCWVNLNIWTVSPYFHTIRLIPHCWADNKPFLVHQGVKEGVYVLICKRYG